MVSVEAGVEPAQVVVENYEYHTLLNSRTSKYPALGCGKPMYRGDNSSVSRQLREGSLPNFVRESSKYDFWELLLPLGGVYAPYFLDFLKNVFRFVGTRDHETKYELGAPLDFDYTIN